MKKSELNKIIKEEIKEVMDAFGSLGYADRGDPVANRSMRAYQIAEDMIRNQMDFPEDSIEDEKLFLAIISALNDKLYERAADMFSSAGSAPDEGEF